MASKSYGKTSCLIVVNDVFLRKVLREMLRHLGFVEIEDAKDGAQALSICGQSTFQLVITELVMPIMGGVELAAKIRRAKTIPTQTPVVGFTKAMTQELVNGSRDAGINELMTSPFSSNVLDKKITAALFETREFITSSAYVGPCRRRRGRASYFGPTRRETDFVTAEPLSTLKVSNAASQQDLAKQLGSIKR